MLPQFQFHRSDASGSRIELPNAVTCKLCESHGLRQAYDLGACALLECCTCGFRFIDYLDSDWTSVIVTDEAAIAKTVKAIESGLESNHDRIASCLELVQLHVSKGPILDVGAGAI